MTEPKRWTKRDVDCAPWGAGYRWVDEADFVRLRDERDEARRVAGVLADALRNNAPCYCDHPLRAGLPPCSRCSALAVFDTLTEEKTDAP